jgi:hypothetical protein
MTNDQPAAQGRGRPREETEARLLRERGTPEERIGPVVPDGTLYPQRESAAYVNEHGVWIDGSPYLELFARRNRLGWDTWGDEALEHLELSA